MDLAKFEKLKHFGVKGSVVLTPALVVNPMWTDFFTPTLKSLVIHSHYVAVALAHQRGAISATTNVFKVFQEQFECGVLRIRDYYPQIEQISLGSIIIDPAKKGKVCQALARQEVFVRVRGKEEEDEDLKPHKGCSGKCATLFFNRAENGELNMSLVN